MTSRTRQFSWNRPLLYNGSLFPTTTIPVEDSKGNIADTPVFADANGMYHSLDPNGNELPVILQHTLPEVTVTAPKKKAQRKLMTSLTGSLSASSPIVNEYDRHVQLNTADEEKAKLLDNQHKQAFMRAAGYDVPNDGVWDSNQQRIWDSLTTHPKEYETNFIGLTEGLADRFKDNDTFFTDPTIITNEVKAYNPDNIDKARTARMNSPVANAIGGTYVPGFLSLYGAGKGAQLLLNPSSISEGISSLIHSPITSVGSIVGGTAGATIGNSAMNTASKVLTGDDYNTVAQEKLGINPTMADFINPATLGVGYLGSKWLTEAERRAAEVAMRTSMGAQNPIPNIIKGWNAVDGKRKSNVLNYNSSLKIQHSTKQPCAASTRVL